MSYLVPNVLYLTKLMFVLIFFVISRGIKIKKKIIRQKSLWLYTKKHFLLIFSINSINFERSPIYVEER